VDEWSATRKSRLTPVFFSPADAVLLYGASTLLERGSNLGAAQSTLSRYALMACIQCAREIKLLFPPPP